jgi:Spy/CpxP family protein refolding chaperone
MARLAITATHTALALLLGALGPVHAADEGLSAVAGVAVPAAVRSHSHHTRAASLDERVQLMAKELDLDASQQAKLKSILLVQRAEVSKAWNDPSVPAAVRVATTQAVSERTAERIRAVLNDEQREKYAKAHQRDAGVGAPGGDVQKWLQANTG